MDFSRVYKPVWMESPIIYKLWFILVIIFLQMNYESSKLYPIFPRYNLLKDMIKDVTHHPDYMEHRHESKVPPEWIIFCQSTILSQLWPDLNIGSPKANCIFSANHYRLKKCTVIKSLWQFLNYAKLHCVPGELTLF